MTDFVFSAQSPETRPPPPFLRAPATDEHALSVPKHKQAMSDVLQDAIAVYETRGLPAADKKKISEMMMGFLSRKF